MRASVTRAAEGFDRRSFTVDEVLRVPETGIISESENIELIGGEIVPMQVKTPLYELLKSALTIEVALTSLPYDRGPKSRLYARHGVQEFWGVHATERRTYIHRALSGGSWTDQSERGPKDALTHPALPGFSLKLADV
jgi:Putative restriction endonuclease